MRPPALESVLVLDGEGRIVDATVPAERMFGRERGFLIGRDCSDGLWSAGDAETWRKWFAEAMASGPEHAGPLRLTGLRHGQGEFAAEVTLTRRAEGDGANRSAAHVRDVSARERLEHALKESIVGPSGEARLSEAAPSPAEVYEAAIRYLRGIPDVDHCALFLVSATRRELSHAFSHGFAVEEDR